VKLNVARVSLDHVRQYAQSLRSHFHAQHSAYTELLSQCNRASQSLLARAFVPFLRRLVTTTSTLSISAIDPAGLLADDDVVTVESSTRQLSRQGTLHTINLANESYAHLNDQAFVEQVYATLLNRLPEPADLAYWLYALENETSRETMLREIQASDEFNAKQGADERAD
jgi:hypothetical protein